VWDNWWERNLNNQVPHIFRLLLRQNGLQCSLSRAFPRCMFKIHMYSRTSVRGGWIIEEKREQIKGGNLSWLFFEVIGLRQPPYICCKNILQINHFPGINCHQITTRFQDKGCKEYYKPKGKHDRLSTKSLNFGLVALCVQVGLRRGGGGL